jgi:CxxC motif-containing protein (DUF1111 family)
MENPTPLGHRPDRAVSATEYLHDSPRPVTSSRPSSGTAVSQSQRDTVAAMQTEDREALLAFLESL